MMLLNSHALWGAQYKFCIKCVTRGITQKGSGWPREGVAAPRCGDPLPPVSEPPWNLPGTSPWGAETPSRRSQSLPGTSPWNRRIRSAHFCSGRPFQPVPFWCRVFQHRGDLFYDTNQCDRGCEHQIQKNKHTMKRQPPAWVASPAPWTCSSKSPSF